MLTTLIRTSKLLMNNHHRSVHTTSVIQLKRKPRVIVNIANHELHKVIEFVRPEELKPWDTRRSGDLEQLPAVDPNWLKSEYQPFADSIDKLSADQRKIFTVRYGHRRDGMKILMQQYIDKTKRHKHDRKSIDFKVTYATYRIRNLQNLLQDPFMLRRGKLRSDVKELIDKRQKYLTQMRHLDYKRFEWIIEVLGIMYKNTAEYTRVERKAAITTLVNLHCNELRDRKMSEYKTQLESEKVPFLKMKLETLQAIRMDEESVGLPSSVDEDIRKTRKLLLELEKDHLTVLPAKVTSTAEIISPVKFVRWDN